LATVLVTIISLVVVVFVSLESVYHYREKWKNYRSTEPRLGHRQVLFQAGVGPYRDLDEKAAFLRLVEHVEEAIASENSATLSVVTLLADTAPNSRTEPANRSAQPGA